MNFEVVLRRRRARAGSCGRHASERLDRLFSNHPYTGGCEASVPNIPKSLSCSKVHESNKFCNTTNARAGRWLWSPCVRRLDRLFSSHLYRAGCEASVPNHDPVREFMAAYQATAVEHGHTINAAMRTREHCHALTCRQVPHPHLVP